MKYQCWKILQMITKCCEICEFYLLFSFIFHENLKKYGMSCSEVQNKSKLFKNYTDKTYKPTKNFSYC